MNFPMQYPIFQFFYWLVNTQGLGGIFVTLMGLSLVVTFGMVLRWVSEGRFANESEVYTYPTSALHDQEEEHS